MKTPFILATLIAAQTFAADGYIAHEWGTFTSVQGAEGVQLGWNPLIAADLPPFVFSTTNPTARRTAAPLPGFLIAGKSRAQDFETRQRMETPVIYFYSAKPQKVDVSVRFNGGRITEWYPQISENKRTVVASVHTHTMKWSGVELVPGLDEASFPKDGKASHYFAARETDATPLRLTSPQGEVQHEKMLFYRGVGGFIAPLNVTQGADSISMKVTEPKTVLPDSFLYIVRGDKALLEPLGAISGKDEKPREVKYDFANAKPLAEVRATFGQQLKAAIVAGGLYDKEAAAMVKTWDDSWFGEQGMRVLYVLPQTWSDRVLPLTFSPAPREIKRVFVGRAEMFTPSQEWALLKEVVRFAGNSETDKTQAVKATEAIGLGRFTDVVINRIYQKIPFTAESAQAAFGLLEAARPKVLPAGWAQAR